MGPASRSHLLCVRPRDSSHDDGSGKTGSPLLAEESPFSQQKVVTAWTASNATFLSFSLSLVKQTSRASLVMLSPGVRPRANPSCVRINPANRAGSADTSPQAPDHLRARRERMIWNHNLLTHREICGQNEVRFLNRKSKFLSKKVFSCVPFLESPFVPSEVIGFQQLCILTGTPSHTTVGEG